MSVTYANGDSGSDRSGTDVPQLRAALAWAGAVGLCLAAALGISAILGASLGETAIRLAASGLVCGFDALFAVAAATLAQRSAAWRLLAILGVLGSVITAVVSLVAIWGASVGETVGRVALVTGSVSSAVGITGFLLSQQRDEDPSAISALMVATLALDWVLTIALTVDVVFAKNSAASGGPEASGVQFPLSGLGFERFLGVTSLLTVLGLLLLPVLRRAHPAYRAARPTRQSRPGISA
jgi:hypothetical protein